MFGLFKKAETVSLEEHQAIVRMMYTRLDRAAEHLRTARAEAEAGEGCVMDEFERRSRFDNIRAEEAAGNVADSMEVRKALMARVHSGEITLEAAQAELSRIKRNAKRNGQITRNQAFTA